jgi:hypothetical protein
MHSGKDKQYLTYTMYTRIEFSYALLKSVLKYSSCSAVLKFGDWRENEMVLRPAR